MMFGFRAYIEKPNDEIEILDLFDNGVNADTTSNDGVYSRFFANASQEGRYSLKCQIWDDGSAYVGLGFTCFSWELFTIFFWWIFHGLIK